MGWQTAVSVIYVTAVALYVVYGFTIKDKQLQEIMTGVGIKKVEITNQLLTGLKYLYLLSMPALVLLGLHLGREIALDGGAPLNVTDSLITAYQVFLYIYLFTILVFVILFFKTVLVTVFHVGTSATAKFKTGGRF